MRGIIVNNQNSGGIRLADFSISGSITDVDISKASKADPIPIGIIVMFKGSFNQVPSDWAFCDGSHGTPNLRDRFIIGGYAPKKGGATGGYKDSQVIAHSHSGTVSTVSNHTHTINYGKTVSSYTGKHRHTVTKASRTRIALQSVGHTEQTYNWGSRSRKTKGWAGEHQHKVTIPATPTTSERSHSHTVKISTSTGGKTGGNLPPYYKLAYIMKVK